jgi:hypothetical protein
VRRQTKTLIELPFFAMPSSAEMLHHLVKRKNRVFACNKGSVGNQYNSNQFFMLILTVFIFKIIIFPSNQSHS